ncbi:MAG: hypothetical protein D6679_03795, partial [Candidatus Hydrogenedentota bacterium]
PPLRTERRRPEGTAAFCLKCWDSNGREPVPHKQNARQGSRARRAARPGGRRQDADERRANPPLSEIPKKNKPGFEGRDRVISESASAVRKRWEGRVRSSRRRSTPPVELK